MIVVTDRRQCGAWVRERLAASTTRREHETLMRASFVCDAWLRLSVESAGEWVLRIGQTLCDPESHYAHLQWTLGGDLVFTLSSDVEPNIARQFADALRWDTADGTSHVVGQRCVPVLAAHISRAVQARKQAEVTT